MKLNKLALPVKAGEQINKIADCIRDKKNISVFGVGESARWAVFAMQNRGVLVEQDYQSAMRAFAFVQCMRSAVFLPARSAEIGMIAKASSELDYQRYETLASVCSNKATHIVTYVSALMQLYPEPSAFSKHILTLKKGSVLSPQELAHSLVSLGYRRTEQVGMTTDFSVRGDIIDIMTATQGGIRVRFDFDEIEDLCQLDDEMLSVAKVEECTICPVGEAFYTDEMKSGICKELDRQASLIHGAGREIAREHIEQIKPAVQSGKRNIPLIMPLINSVSLPEFFSAYPIIIGNAKLCYDSAVAKEDGHSSRVCELISSGHGLQSSFEQVKKADLVLCDTAMSVLTFHTGLSQNRFTSTDEVIELSSEIIPNFAHDSGSLSGYLQGKMSQGYTAFLAYGSQSVAQKAKSVLRAELESEIESGQIVVSDAFLAESFALEDSKQLFVGTYSLSHKMSDTKKRKVDVVPPPEVGDYVVHEKHGIGKVVQIDRLNLSGVEHDYVVVLYAEDSKLYLPVENLDRLSKYFYESNPPALSKLGGAQFARVVAKVKSSVREMAINLVELYSERAKKRGHIYKHMPEVMDEFISAFEYPDTPDQSVSTSECLNDLSLGKVMDRLLCGDVGFGKTEVAMRVAYRVAYEGKQVAFLCPTTLLARQHYHTLVKRMESFGLSVGVMSRLNSTAHNNEVTRRLQTGELDIVVGTHKLLGKNIKFADLGLLILDEEHKFGVAQKEKLKQIKTNVNVLSMSATPLPRTLHMSLGGFRDMSSLTIPPVNRLAVETYVAEMSNGLIYDALTKEKQRGGQSFIVFNRVMGIEKFAYEIRQIMGEHYKLSFVHGQMNPSEVEKQIELFASGQLDGLIATTIIENGIDMPNANTMIITNANHFGLSQMYQLRGRVGRSSTQASVYFTYNKTSVLSETAIRRLDSIMQCREIGSGQLLAKRDLEIRGAGNILGAEQHGHMEQVGYDMYVKLLNEVVSELKGEKVTRGSEVRVNVDFDAYLPNEYIGAEELRNSLYGKIAKISDIEELRKIRNNLTDMYGKPPAVVNNLLVVGLVKNVAASVGACEVMLINRNSSIVFEKAVDIPTHFAECAGKAGGSIVVKEKAHIVLPHYKGMVKFLSNYKSN